DERKRGENLRWLSRLHWFLGRKTDAERYTIESVTVLEKLTPGPELAMAYSSRAQLHMLSDEIEQAVYWGSRAVDLAGQLGATETLAHALNNVGAAEYRGGKDEGRLKLEESLRLALANNFQEHASRAFTNLAHLTLRNRNYRLAMRYLDSGIAYTTEHDIDAFKIYMTASRARANFEQGNWDTAADDTRSVLSHQRIPPITRISALAVFGHLRVRRGDPDAERVLNEARELAMQTGELQRVAPVASALVELAWVKGDLGQLEIEARSLLEMLI